MYKEKQAPQSSHMVQLIKGFCYCIVETIHKGYGILTLYKLGTPLDHHKAMLICPYQRKCAAIKMVLFGKKENSRFNQEYDLPIIVTTVLSLI